MQDYKNSSTNRLVLRERILNTAMSSFAQHGIKAVKMDDIAQQLGISKRTLYEIYNNKELLLYEGVKNYKRQKDEMIARIMQVSPNVMDVILKFKSSVLQGTGEVPQGESLLRGRPRGIQPAIHQVPLAWCRRGLFL